MTFEQQVAALAPLGLPPRQTALLVTVALHGGCCLRRQFDAFVGCRRGGVGRDELVWFFRVRAAVERRDLREFSVADLDRYCDLRRSLETLPVERLYVEWWRDRDAVLAGSSTFDRPSATQMQVLVHHLPWRYHQFGQLPGAA